MSEEEMIEKLDQIVKKDYDCFVEEEFTIAAAAAMIEKAMEK